MARHRTYSVAFKRQVAQEYLAGDSLHGLAKRHDLARNLIRIWVAKYEAGAFDDDARAADLLQDPAVHSWMRHRLVPIVGEQGGEHDGHDGTGRWPGGARPTRWRRRASA